MYRLLTVKYKLTQRERESVCVCTADRRVTFLGLIHPPPHSWTQRNSISTFLVKIKKKKDNTLFPDTLMRKFDFQRENFLLSSQHK